ncbi:MAG: lipocalin family protein [Candidatus Cyclobacteriaceae bacterium M3_2C_046]
MKNLYFLLIVFLASSVLFSCSKDDEEAFTQADLVGTWNGEKMTLSFSGDGFDETTKALLETFFPPEIPLTGVTYEFKDDQTLEVSGSDDPDMNGTGTWSLAGKELSVTSAGETSKFMVKQLTSSKLELYVKETNDAAGMDITLESSMFFNK